MNLQVTDIKVSSKQNAAIEWNYQEIKSFLEDALTDYNNAVVTTDSIKTYKNDRAELNKLADKMKRFRIDTVNELMKNVEPFKDQAKELWTMIDEARMVVDKQIKHLEELAREEKRELALSLIDAVSHEIELKDKYRAMVEVKSEYLNATCNPTKMKKLITEQFEALLKEQQAEQFKYDSVASIIEAYNDKLTFKYSVDDFVYLMEKEVTEIVRVVKAKVEQRYQDEQAELKRIEEEQERAIKAAEEKAKRDAEAEAQRKAEEEERKHQEELRAAEEAAAEELRQLQADADRREAEALQVAQEVTESFDSFVPADEPEEVEKEMILKFQVTGSEEKLQKLMAYMDQFDFNYKRLF